MTPRVAVTLLAQSPEQGRDLAEQAFQEMDRVVPLLNRHVSSSAVSVLNDQGRLQKAPEELTTVLREARRIHDVSAGIFDPSVKPLVDHAATGDASPTPPRALLDLVDMRAVRVRRRSVRLGKEGMGLTLDGIAKGYVVDRMAAALEGQGCSNWLIDAGGDIRVSGTREHGTPWRIGVQDPDKGGTYPAVTELSRGAVATSGGYERYYDREGRRHHIVNSATGRSPVLVRSASVYAPSTMMADALATTLFAMEPRRAPAFIDAIPGCSCLLVDCAGGTLRSRGWRDAPSPTLRA
jgi:thiamine biosynthesis lipoprotein